MICEHRVISSATLECLGAQQGDAVGAYLDADAFSFVAGQRQVLGQISRGVAARFGRTTVGGQALRGALSIVRGLCPDHRARVLESFRTSASCAAIVLQTRLSLHAGGWPLRSDGYDRQLALQGV